MKHSIVIRSLLLFVLFFNSLLLAGQSPVTKQLLDSGWYHYQNGNLSYAKQLNDACIRLSREMKDLSTGAKCFINNGTIAYVEGNFELALALYDSSLKIYSFLRDTVQSVHALRNMAMTSRKRSLYGQGIRYCSQALQLLNSDRHQDLKALVLNTSATLFESTGNLEYARKSLLQALPIVSEQGKQNLLTNLGNIYFKVGKIDSAIYCYQQSLRSASGLPERALILNNLGECYIALHATVQAANVLGESLSIRMKSDSLAMVSTYNNLAQLSILENRLANAKNYLISVERELNKHPNEREALKFYLLQKKYLQAVGEYKRASSFDDRYDSLNRKIFEEERLKVDELQSAYEISERDQKLKLQAQELKLHLASIKQKSLINQLVISGIILLLIVATALFYLYRVNSKLRYRNEVLVHEQNHRVKNNLQMIASLLSVQSASHDDETIKTILSQNENRIQSIALLHRMLYNAEVSATVSLAQYLADLTGELKHALGAPGAMFKLNTEVDKLSIESTISLGLILNELITNSVKYASSPDVLQISISVLKKEHQGHLEYQDNGKSFDTSSFHKGGTFGARLITIQSKQMKGKFNVSSSNGFNFILTFPIT